MSKRKPGLPRYAMPFLTAGIGAGISVAHALHQRDREDVLMRFEGDPEFGKKVAAFVYRSMDADIRGGTTDKPENFDAMIDAIIDMYKGGD